MALRIRFNSPVILTFSIIAAAIFFINKGMNGAFDSILILSPHFNTSVVSDYISLFTYMMGHASIEHLLGNLSFILLIGPIIEEKYGSGNTLFMILITALITGILNILFFSSGLLGASGIVFMLIILVSFTNVDDGSIPLTFILILLLFVGKEVLNSFEENNISEFAHIAGGVIGSLFGFIMKRKKHTPPTLPVP